MQSLPTSPSIPSAPLPRERRLVRGFTLTELLVVLAVTSVLLLILFIPLTRTIELSKRAEAQARGQAVTREAMKRIQRELALALEVYQPRPIAVWGYDLWQPYGTRDRPQAGAQPERYVNRVGVLAFRLPRMRYFNPIRRQYITQDDLNNAGFGGVPEEQLALSFDPRHPGEPVELRPVEPISPSTRIVAYFVGLKNPTRVDAMGRPVYDNIALWGRNLFPSTGSTLHTYALYRIEFDPADPRYQNWNLPNGQPNPDFFYDQTPVTVGAITQPQAQWWKDGTQSIIDAESADVIRWVETAGGKRVPQVMVNFGPSPVTEEVAQPNRQPGQYLLDGTTVPSEIPPTEYATYNSHWIGAQPWTPLTGELLPLPTALVMGPQAVGGVTEGPHITVYDPSEPNPALRVKFDSMDPTVRQRLLTYDPLGGRVVFGITRRQFNPNPANQLEQIRTEFFDATVDTTTFTTNLTGPNGDVENDPNGMPSAFGNTKAAFPWAMVVPGSEAIQLYDETVNETRLLRRAGWTGLPGGLNRIVAQADLEPDEYSIDYSTGEITLADRNPAQWAGIGPGGPIHLMVRYRFQTNLPTDVVRVTYNSRQALLVNVGVVFYTRANQEALPFETSQRIVVANLKR